jgi:hypothetical protein
MHALLNRNASFAEPAALPKAKKEHYHAVRAIC